MTAAGSLGEVRRLTSMVLLALGAAACGPPPELQPDERLQEELGVSARSEVHRIAITGGEEETVMPREVTVPGDALVEFVTTDSWVHEVRFDLDSLGAPARDFLLQSDQAASPPMVSPDSRFVVSLEGAPAGRYPFQIEGNGASTRGAVVVLSGGS